jgi:hypothetical protein
LYIGLLSYHHTKKRTLPDEASDDDELEDEDEMNIDHASKDKTMGASVVREPKVGGDPKKSGLTDYEEQDEESAAKSEEGNERSEALMNAFLDDPETSIAIFFSSHFRNKGSIWFVATSLAQIDFLIVTVSFTIGLRAVAEMGLFFCHSS